jgi:hypothetical protein
VLDGHGHGPHADSGCTAMENLRIVTVRDFGWEITHQAVSRRPPISLHTMVARTHMHTYDANVWDLSLVQGPFSVAPCPNPNRSIRNFLSIRCLGRTVTRSAVRRLKCSTTERSGQ